MEGLTFEGKGQINPLIPKPEPFRQKIPPSPSKKKVIVIAGPTASGKTALSLELSRLLDGEIISADSIQVYRGMDIGTAKATKEERLEIPHHLIDTCDLCENFNVVQFCQRAQSTIKEILKRDKVPIIVGGTGFYLHALIYGPPKGPAASPEIRQKISSEIERLGTEALYDKLCHYDPDYAETISNRDKQKVIRALEIISLTGKKVTDFPKGREEEQTKEFDFLCWFVHFPREILYPQIEMR